MTSVRLDDGTQSNKCLLDGKLLSVDQHFWFMLSLWVIGESDLELYESAISGFMIYHTV